MRRTLLWSLFIFGAALAGRSQAENPDITGRWHLLSSSESESPLPQHRMDLRFWRESGAWKGAILSRRNDGNEFPLAMVQLGGATLRFQMTMPAGQAQSDAATMVMTRQGEHWVGRWTPGAGQELKLVPGGR